MTTGHDSDPGAQAFDARLQRLHARAVEHVPMGTQLQLRPRRTPAAGAPARARLHGWPLAATCALALVAGGLLLRHPTTGHRGATPAPTLPSAQSGDTDADVYAALDESPELYLWLGSNDTASLVTE